MLDWWRKFSIRDNKIKISIFIFHQMRRWQNFHHDLLRSEKMYENKSQKKMELWEFFINHGLEAWIGSLNSDFRNHLFYIKNRKKENCMFFLPNKINKILNMFKIFSHSSTKLTRPRNKCPNEHKFNFSSIIRNLK